MREPVEAELQSHAAALRALARDLVGDQHADDLLQDTAVQALQAPPPRPGALGGWLATVLRHLASKHRRTERRRREREQRAARPEALPPVDREAADRDSLRRLTDALLQLPQPYQATLLARYLRERSPAEIARQDGVPVDTVKTRLKRGLVLLRERLDRGDGDWRAAFAAGFGMQGVLLMGIGVKFAAAAAAVVLAASGVWLWSAAGAGGRGPEPPPASTPLASTPLASTMPVAPESAAAAAARAAAPQRSEVPGPTDTRATLRGRCVDGTGAPLAGVGVSLSAAPGGGGDASGPDLVLRLPGDPEPLRMEATTGADGSFMLRFVPRDGERHALLLRRDGLASMSAHWQQILAGQEIDLGDVAMLPVVAVRGRLVDSDGKPVADAQLNLRCEVLPRRVQAVGGDVARTDAAGDFTFRAALAPGRGTLSVSDRALLSPADIELLAPATLLQLQVRAEPPPTTIGGVVIDENGAPVRATVCVEPAGGRASVEPDGSFVLEAPGADAEPVELSVTAAGFEDLRTPPQAWGTTGLRLQLQRCGSQTVFVVRASDGTPVEEFSLLGVEAPAAGGSSARNFTSVDGGHHRGGRVDLHLQSSEYRIVVEPADRSLAVTPPLPFRVGADGAASLVVRLEQRCTRTLRLQRADGTALAGAQAKLCLAPEDPRFADLQLAMDLRRWAREAAPAQNCYLQIDTGSTDAAGEVVLHGARGGRYSLLLPGPGHAPQRADGVVFDTDAPLVVTVAAGATLRGRCTPASAITDLRQLAGELPSHESGPWVQLRNDAGARFPPGGALACADDGTFVLEHAPAGSWRLMLRYAQRLGAGTNSHELEVGRVTLRDGETDERAIDLLPLQTGVGEVEAVVLHNGEPLANARLMLRADAAAGSPALAARVSASVDTDADGRFRCRRTVGRYFVEWAPVDGRAAGLAPGNALRSDGTFEVAREATATPRLQLRTGRLRVRVLAADGAQAAGVAVELLDAAGERRHTLPRTAADGTAEQLVEATTFTCRAGGEHGTRLGSASVLQGTTTTVELRLPPRR